MDRPNIIVAVFDSLSPRYLTQWGGPIDFLPAGIEPFVVRNCYTAATITTPSVTTMFTGLYPEHHKVTSHWERKLFKLDVSVPTLAQILYENGYQTLLAVNEYLGLALYNRTGISKGFEKRYEIKCPHNPPRVFTNALKLTDPQITRKPFFLFLHYFNTHMPYGRKEHFVPGGRLRFKWQDPKFSMEQAYVKRIKDTAAAVMLPTYDFACKHDAMLIVLSDHGQTFIKRNVGGHAHWVNEDTARVVWLTVNGSSEVNEGLHSLVDLMPSILDSAGIEHPQCDGISVHRGSHDEVYCISEWHAPTWPKVFASITEAGFEYGIKDIPKGVAIAGEDKVAARLRALGYIG